METTALITHLEYVEKEGSIEFMLYARTKDNKKACFIDNFEDYFFVDVKNKNFDKETKEKLKNYNYTDTDFEIHDQSSQIIKINTPNSKITKELYDYLIQKGFDCYEQDVPLPKKYLTEKKIKINSTYNFSYDDIESDQKVDFVGKVKSMEEINENIDLKIAYFDIETYDDGLGINYNKNEILMISIICEEKKIMLISKKIKHANTFCFESEKEMLEEFKKIIDNLKPDAICGYNVKGFDIPYIIQRFKKYNLPLSFGSNNSDIIEMRTKEKYDISGIIILDLFLLIRNIFRNTVDSGYSLDNVSKHLLGMKKDEVDFIEMSKEWNKEELPYSFEKYVDYCFKDTQLCISLFEYFKKEISEFQLMLNVDLEEITSLSFSQVVEQFLINNAHNYNQIIPNKPDENMIRERSNMHIKGAFVYDPKPGFYQNIAVYDFTSLYPTIIESYNITKGTIVLNKKDKCIKVPDLDFYVRQDKKAFIPTIIEQIVEKRIKLKEEIKIEKNKSELQAKISKLQTLKIIANSLYGYLAFYMARWYSFEAAESVTAFGRYNIKKVISNFEENNFKVIYSDTDSIFVLIDDNQKEADKIVSKINDKLPGMMSLEKEGIFKSGIFIIQRGIKEKGAKKKYAMLSYDNKYKIAGMEMVRGDWSFVARDIQKQILYFLLDKQNIDESIEFVKKECKNLLKRPVKDFIISTKLTKNIEEYNSVGPHVVVAKQMRDRGLTIRAGTNIKYVITKSNSSKIGDRAKIPDDISVKDLDLDYYINNQIIPPLEGIFKVFDIDIKSKISETNSKLDSFF